MRGRKKDGAEIRPASRRMPSARLILETRGPADNCSALFFFIAGIDRGTIQKTMFGWFKSVRERELNPENPGKGVSGTVAFANKTGTWTEQFNLVSLLKSVLEEAGHKVKQERCA